jgi:hypothetical protein
MADHKNQHFVPRSALKPFTLNADGLAINVFNIKRHRAIQNAPVKGQCARVYLYGVDLTIEKLLVRLEGQYARIIANLSLGGQLNDADLEWLHLFAMVQFRRTAQTIEEMRKFNERMAEITFKNHPEQRPKDDRTDNELMLVSLKIGFEHMKYITDLKLTVFRNQTDSDFVISDNPLVLTNRFYFQRLRRGNFGLASSGALLVMPLGPRLCSVWHDRGVYSVTNASGTPFADIKKASDISAINEWQYLNAQNNIYFARWSDRTHIGEQIVKVTEKRAAPRTKAAIFVRDQAAPGESYRVGTEEEETTAKETLVMASQVHLEPSTWPSQIKFRSKPRAFSNGTAAGYVRSAEWLKGS